MCFHKLSHSLKEKQTTFLESQEDICPAAMLDIFNGCFENTPCHLSILGNPGMLFFNNFSVSENIK